MIDQPWIMDARADIGKYHDGPDVPRLAQEVSAVFPDFADYCRLANRTTAWCGIFIAAKLSKYHIRPPTGFMWVNNWTHFGTPVEPGHEIPGDVAIFLGHPHHVTFVNGHGWFVGGNQHDGVTSTRYRAPDVIRRPPQPPVGAPGAVAGASDASRSVNH